jgi:hypothetical protein
VVPDPEAYARRKAQAAAAVAGMNSPASTQATAVASMATIGPSFGGQFEDDLTPPDPTGAMGVDRFIQIVNLRMGIYSRVGALIGSAPIEQLVGGFHIDYSDPQVLWDTATKRFYYLIWHVTDATMRWGFSRTARPSAIPGSFCNYAATFRLPTRSLPDYPKLGQSKYFLLIGVNYFDEHRDFDGGALLWIDKPQVKGTVSTCPSVSGFRTGAFMDLRNADGTRTDAPVPAQQVDSFSRGWVMATQEMFSVPASTYISVFPVTRNPTTGTPVLGAPQTVTVPSFAMPPNAPQCPSGDFLDTLDGRLEHAVAAIDPMHGGRVALWTAHSVIGPSGSEERWYEIRPGSTPRVLQSGKAASNSLYVFNGAISPDRVVRKAGSAFGQNMAMTFTTSSSTQCPAVQMVSKRGADAQSPFVLVKQSPVRYSDALTCGSGCRWGDYAGAAPDPGASLAGETGIVWLTNEWNVEIDLSVKAAWRTWIWAATP